MKSTEVSGTSVGVPWYVRHPGRLLPQGSRAKAGYPTFPTNWDDFKALAKALQTKAGAKWGVAAAGGRCGLLPDDASVPSGRAARS